MAFWIIGTQHLGGDIPPASEFVGWDSPEHPAFTYEDATC